MATNNVITSVQISEEMQGVYREEAARRGLSVGAVMREALTAHRDNAFATNVHLSKRRKARRGNKGARG